jgi:hypothetical protein
MVVLEKEWEWPACGRAGNQLESIGQEHQLVKFGGPDAVESS